MRYFEDFHVGETFVLEPVAVTATDIVEFARRYDPQPFHLDEAAGRETHFGGLVASGWHTVALHMGAYVRTLDGGGASLGSPGIEGLRWRAPVRPGDTLSGTVTIVAATPSERDPRRGTLTTEHEVRNQDGVVVMTMTARSFFARRSPSA